MTPEEQKLFSELKKRGVAVAPDLLKEVDDGQGPRNVYPFDPKTTSVQPASDDGHVQPSVAYAGGITSGRGNPAERSGGTNMPPKVPGASAAPSPPQMTGSNLPGSGIRQLPPVGQQYPTQTVTIPTSVFTSSREQEPDEQAPIGSPRTAGGQAANDPKVLAKTLAQQLKTPVVVTQEKSYTDPSRVSPFESPLVQPVPIAHQHAATTLQRPIPTPSSQVTRYPGDFNEPNPLPMDKPSASDSDGVLKPGDFPANFLDAGVRKQKVVSQIVRESDAGE
jgi:hypothetical protein